MATTTFIGALLVAAGLVYMALAAIFRGRMTDPHASAGDPAGRTLEPRRRGMGFLGLKANWPGLLIVVIGVIFLLIPAVQG
ncbi:hypothetical protein N8D56_03125 [Devosia sp. A8/3-2]|nr:hypothetical protein N8D56_03125 [Devosia sp. A8/3-2]